MLSQSIFHNKQILCTFLIFNIYIRVLYLKYFVMITFVNFVVLFHTVFSFDHGKLTYTLCEPNEKSKIFPGSIQNGTHNVKIHRTKFELTLFHSALAPMKNFFNVTEILLKKNLMKPVDVKFSSNNSSLVQKLLKVKKNDKQTLAEICKHEVLTEKDSVDFMRIETILGLGLNCLKKINEDFVEFPVKFFKAFRKWKIKLF